MGENPPIATASSPSEGANDTPTRILIAVNQSSIKGYPNPSISSLAAFNWLTQTLIPTAARPNFKLLILHVQVPDEDAFNDMDSLYATNDDFNEMKHGERARGIHLLQHFVSLCNEIKLPCKAWIKKGDTREVICKEVARVHPVMLVVGSRGLKAVHRVFVGTVSEHCTKHVACPVVVIKRKAEETPDDPVDD